MAGNGLPVSSHHVQHKTRRLAVGLLVLLLVDFLWVASSELTKFIFQTEDFHRPFFTTYIKTCMFIVYLIGFIVHRPWRNQCVGSTSHLDGFEPLVEEDGVISSPVEPELSEPIYEPLRRSSDGDSEKGSAASSDTESQKSGHTESSIKSVRFKKRHEVRHLPASEADAAKASRLSYDSWLRLQDILGVSGTVGLPNSQHRLPVRKVAKLALQFCFLWFLGNVAYQQAINLTQAGIVNVLSSSSSLFTLVLAAIFPSCLADRFTVSKLLAVILNCAGVALIAWVDENKFEGGFPIGAIWALIGAAAYASYLVLLRRKADSEDRLDISMFFGFLGLFNLALLWPGFYFLHISHLEELYPLPNRTQFFYITVNGLLGTVLSEYLWLWGCFLTSSLIATLSLSLTVPMSIVADAILWKKSYPWPFMAGGGLVFISFLCAALLQHYDNWDPIYIAIRRICQRLLYIPCCLMSRCCRRVFGSGGGHAKGSGNNRVMRELDREQGESLISAGINS